MIQFILLALILLIGAPSLVMLRYASNRIYTEESVPKIKAAIVFGAGLTADGRATTVLKDRVATAAALFKAGKVEILLLSGDNRFLNYNEPGAMKEYALQIDIPEEAIILDYAGRRTYDTCYRAKEIFQLSKVILVTQKFHLPRALYTCSSLGLEAVGVAADMRTYRGTGYWNIREIPARLIAFIQVHFTHPEPVLGDQEPIFPVE